MKFIKMMYVPILAVILLSGCVTTGPSVSETNIVTLSDEPKISFSSSGWSYTDTTNPFLLTPDYLTNAMIGVSRFKVGDELLNNGPKVPATLSAESIQQLMKKRLADKAELSMSHKIVGRHTAIVATYIDGEKQGVEYAFELKGYLIHVLLLAKQGKYFEHGKMVAHKLVESMNPL